MLNKKRIQQWFLSNERIISLIIVIMLLCVDIYLIIDYFYQQENASFFTFINRSIACFSTGIWITVIITRSKNNELKKFFIKMYANAEKLYFHGFKMSHYIDRDVFLRLEDWLETGQCFEFSILAMILLKNFETARLCRGDCFDNDSKLRTRHSWVEVKIPLNGWYVVDFAWLFPAFCKRRYYFDHRNSVKIVRKWICSHDEFWSIQLSNIIFNAMQNSKTSYILLELSGYSNPDKGYEFSEWVSKKAKLQFSDGTIMVPFESYSGKPVSTQIIRDFVKNPKRKNPKAKSIRLAKQLIHKYKL